MFCNYPLINFYSFQPFQQKFSIFSSLPLSFKPATPAYYIFRNFVNLQKIKISLPLFFCTREYFCIDILIFYAKKTTHTEYVFFHHRKAPDTPGELWYAKCIGIEDEETACPISQFHGKTDVHGVIENFIKLNGLPLVVSTPVFMSCTKATLFCTVSVYIWF